MESHKLLLHGKTKMKGVMEEDSDEDEVELFSRRRSPAQAKSCEVCGVFLVFVSLTLLATTVIFGVRYMSALREMTRLEEENLHIKIALDNPGHVIDLAHKITEAKNSISQLKHDLASCRAQQQSKSAETSKNLSPALPTGNPGEKSASDAPCVIVQAPGNSAVVERSFRFHAAVALLLLTVIHWMFAA